jgi:hypothetical protein
MIHRVVLVGTCAVAVPTAVACTARGLQVVDSCVPSQQSYQVYTNSMLFCMVSSLCQGIAALLQDLRQQQESARKCCCVLSALNVRWNPPRLYLFCE